MSVAVAERIAALAAQAITARGVFHLALAGGETPRRCYECLRELPVDWAQVHIYFGDERCLPVGDNQRNDSMANDALLRHVAIPQINVHRIPAELGAVQAATHYAEIMKQVGQLDLVLLGLGEDGHTASLFPDNPAMDSAASVVAVFNAPKPPAERVSLGMTTVNAARQTLFLIAGAGKQQAIKRIAQGEPLPASQVIGAEWHADRAAWPG
ncbi:MAG: 6-phosphogluconolactonase [Proteobacteria bacterium]|nr:6-phosphogluconolactonase [Pseudomonadota bacterium]